MRPLWQRRLEAGLCRACEMPRASTSEVFCPHHLLQASAWRRNNPKSRKGAWRWMSDDERRRLLPEIRKCISLGISYADMSGLLGRSRFILRDIVRRAAEGRF